MDEMSGDMGIFKGTESGMLKGMFRKDRFKGSERGTFIKDMGKEGMDIDISVGDLESGGGVVSAEGEGEGEIVMVVEVAVSCREGCTSEEVVVVIGSVVGWMSVD